MEQSEYRTYYNLEESIKLCLVGETLLISNSQGDIPPQEYQVVTLADGPPVPQKGSGETPNIGTGNLPNTWITDTKGNAKALPVGSTLSKVGDTSGRTLSINSFGLVWNDQE